MRSIIIRSMITGSVIGLSATAAYAQSEYFDREKYEAVTDRYQPDFDPEPVRLGAFLVNAEGSLEVTSDDNIFAANGNDAANAEESDTILSLGLNARARTDWNNHEIGLRGRFNQNEYSDFADESNSEIFLGANGRYDVSREVNFGADLTFIEGVQSRANYANGTLLDEPVKINQVAFAVSGRYQSERLRWDNSVRIQRSDYDDGLFRGTNTVFEQDFRDNDLTEATSRVSYAISPNIAVFGQGTLRQAKYDTDQIVFDAVSNSNTTRSRDSDGYILAAGADFETSNLLRGDIAVGYFSEDKKDQAFQDFDGLSVNGSLEWFPTRLTTVALTSARRATDNGLIESPGTLQTQFGASVSHEFSRQIIGTVFGELVKDDYQDIAREDDFSRFGANVAYRLNKRVHLNGEYQNVKRDGSGTVGFDPDFTANVFTLGIRVFP